MTVLLWVMGVLLGLCMLVALTRIGIHAEFSDTGTVIRVSVGPLHIQVSPGKAKKEETLQNDQKIKRAEEAPKKKKKAGVKPSLKEVKSLIRTLWPPVKKALGRTRKSIRIKPMQLSLILGGEEDPAAAAQLYGELQAAIWTAMPALEQLLVIHDPFIHTEINFDARETKLKGTMGLSVRIGSLLRIALGIAVPAIAWYLSFRKAYTMKQPPEPTKAVGTAN